MAFRRGLIQFVSICLENAYKNILSDLFCEIDPLQNASF